MLNIFPIEIINREHSIPYAQYSRELYEKVIQPSIIENDIVLKIRKSVTKANLTRNDIEECLKLVAEYYSRIHGIRFKHLKEKSLPLEVYELIEKNPLELMDSVILSFAKSQLKNYLNWDTRRQKYIYCVNSGGKELFLKLNNRFSVEYRNKIKRRMRDLNRKHNDAKTVLLTLTIDPKKFDSKLQMWTDIKKHLNRFFTSVRYSLKKQGREFPQYLCTVQAQRNGNPHIHIVFFNATRLLDWRKIEKLWHLGFIFINRSSSGGRIHHPVSYVTRYITRCFTKTDNENLLTQSLVWFFGLRSYTCSRGLIEPLNSQGSEFTALCFILLHPDTDVNSMVEKVHCYVHNIMKYRPKT